MDPQSMKLMLATVGLVVALVRIIEGLINRFVPSPIENAMTNILNRVDKNSASAAHRSKVLLDIHAGPSAKTADGGYKWYFPARMPEVLEETVDTLKEVSTKIEHSERISKELSVSIQKQTEATTKLADNMVKRING